MDVEEIGVVLSRASELRAKVSECIKRGLSGPSPQTVRHEVEEESDSEEENTAGLNSSAHRAHFKAREDIETQSLISVKNALESLEMQLSSLQTLQQQQRLERETALAELDESRRDLIEKLKGYRGKELGIIQEACAFAFSGEPLEQTDDVILPPYGRRLPNSFMTSIYDYSPVIHSAQVARKKTVTHEPSKAMAERSERANSHFAEGNLENGSQNKSANMTKPVSFFGRMFSWTTKAVLVVASVASVYTLASLDPKLNKRGTSIKLPILLPRNVGNELLPKTETAYRCPPGKVLMYEDGVPKCFVKERVEVPFEPVVNNPDISYGCG